ncbi:MAG: hypothetical protein FWD69_11100 [Polyangiaceae bacterium]|nr:hypothetical protein [Polyangiaceae bacterium]
MSDQQPTRIRLALVTIAALTAAGALYAILRIGQALVFREADPALIFYSPHAGYFWRAWTAAYLGVMAGFCVWVWSQANAARVARVLAGGVIVTAAIALAQSVLVP